MHRIICFLLLLIISMTSIVVAEEQKFKETDGIIYFHGDYNYPVWSMGNRVGAVADLSSAYIVEENEKWKLIGFLSFPIVLHKHSALEEAIPLEDELHECWFWQKKRTGEFFFNRDGIPGNKVEGEAFFLEFIVYQMILDAAEANTS